MTTWTHPRHPLIEARMDMCDGQPFVRGTRMKASKFAKLFRGLLGYSTLASEYGTLAVEASLRFELDESAKRAWRKWYREGGK